MIMVREFPPLLTWTGVAFTLVAGILGAMRQD